MVRKSLDGSFESEPSDFEISPVKNPDAFTAEFLSNLKAVEPKALNFKTLLNDPQIDSESENSEIFYQNSESFMTELNKILYTFYDNEVKFEGYQDFFAPKARPETIETKNPQIGNLQTILALMKAETPKISAPEENNFSSLEIKVKNHKHEVGIYASLLDEIKVDKQKKHLIYTVDNDLFDYWCCKSKMDEDKLNKILKVWASDNWEGLYDPPAWLTIDMFYMALTDEMSSTIKSEKVIEAKIHLEMARLTTTKVMPDILKKGAMKYLENLIQMTDIDSNDNFKEEKSLAIFMHIIYKKMEDIFLEQNLKLFKLKNDLKQICNDAVQEWKNMIEFYRKISKSYVHYIKLLQKLQNK